jgi:hypothetical protein
MGRNPWNSLLFVSSVKPPLKHPAFRRLNGGHMRSWSTTFRPQFCHRIGTTPCWSWHYPRHPPAPISSRKLSSPKGGDSELQKMMFHQTTEIYWNILIFIISMYIYIYHYISFEWSFKVGISLAEIYKLSIKCQLMPWVWVETYYFPQNLTIKDGIHNRDSVLQKGSFFQLCIVCSSVKMVIYFVSYIPMPDSDASGQ